MADGLETIEEMREAYTRSVLISSPEMRRDRMAAFDRWLAAHDRVVRAEALREAAKQVHAEARWQYENHLRGIPGSQIVYQRMTVMETVFNDGTERLEATDD